MTPKIYISAGHIYFNDEMVASINTYMRPTVLEEFEEQLNDFSFLPEKIKENIKKKKEAEVVSALRNFEKGKDEGIKKGKELGEETGRKKGLIEGFTNGHSIGKSEGYKEGYKDGYEDGIARWGEQL